MAKTLQLNFSTLTGKKVMLTVDAPKENLTALQVSTAMQGIIDSTVFGKDGYALSEIVGARIVERNVTELIQN
jgi:hypothetical protein